jgi:hypothetical protein
MGYHICEDSEQIPIADFQVPNEQQVKETSSKFDLVCDFMQVHQGSEFQERWQDPGPSLSAMHSTYNSPQPPGLYSLQPLGYASRPQWAA